jgi:multimeric flavodoxin WrbA
MITIIASTNRPGSSTLKMAKYYQQKLQEKGVEANLLSLAQLPPTLSKPTCMANGARRICPDSENNYRNR